MTRVRSRAPPLKGVAQKRPQDSPSSRRQRVWRKTAEAPWRAWRVEFERRAERGVDALSADTRERVIRALDKLATDPHRASNVKTLHGGSFRLRIGDYQVIYALEGDVLVVLVVKIGHRRDVYRSK